MQDTFIFCTPVCGMRPMNVTKPQHDIWSISKTLINIFIRLLHPLANYTNVVRPAGKWDKLTVKIDEIIRATQTFVRYCYLLSTQPGRMDFKNV